MSPQPHESPIKQSPTDPKNWLESDIDTATITTLTERVENESAKRNIDNLPHPSAIELVQQLRIQMLGDPSEISDSSVEMLIRRQDYDVLPRDYVIDWRIPILGPINSIVRRVINDEIRRFLFPPLKRQSSLNRQLVDAIQELKDENQLLRAEIYRLNSQAKTKESTPYSIESNVNE